MYTFQLRSVLATVIITALAAAKVQARATSVSFSNNCGAGYPEATLNGVIVSTGATYVTDAPFIGLIAYLQTGKCGQNGEGCSFVNSTTSDGISITEIIGGSGGSISFTYQDASGCDGLGSSQPGQVVECAADGFNLFISFCSNDNIQH